MEPNGQNVEEFEMQGLGVDSFGGVFIGELVVSGQLAC